jgi:hypothetical protein
MPSANTNINSPKETKSSKEQDERKLERFAIRADPEDFVGDVFDGWKVTSISDGWLHLTRIKDFDKKTHTGALVETITPAV